MALRVGEESSASAKSATRQMEHRFQSLTETAAIINVTSFDQKKQPHIASLYERGLWGFTDTVDHRERWEQLEEGMRILLYGDMGVRMACHLRSRERSTRPVEFWTKDPTGYPLHLYLDPINKSVDGIPPLTRDQLVTNYDIPIFKVARFSILLFGEKAKGATYPLEKFEKPWIDFLKNNNLPLEPKPRDPIQQLQHQLQTKDRRIEDLEELLHTKDERIKELERKLDETGRRPPIEDVIEAIEKLQQLSHEKFEWQLKRAFDELGFDARWNGKLENGQAAQSAPRGKPDVEVEAPLAGDPYFIVVEGTKSEEEKYQVTEVMGAVDHSEVFPGPSYKTCYRLVVAPRLRRSAVETCRKHPDPPVMLLSCEDLVRILRFHCDVGGTTQEELRNLFEKVHGRGELTTEHIQEWRRDVEEQRKKLSLVLDVYDILYTDKGFMWPREIWRALNKVREEQARPEEEMPEVLDILKILNMIGALIVKPNQDPEKSNYKVALTPEGFRLRIKKLEETIRSYQSRQQKRPEDESGTQTLMK